MWLLWRQLMRQLGPFAFDHGSAFHPRYGRCVLYRVTQSTPFHRVFDFHGGPPLLELGTLDEMQRPRPSIFTVQRIRSAGLLGLSGGRAHQVRSIGHGAKF